jgi:transcription factor SPN1
VIYNAENINDDNANKQGRGGDEEEDEELIPNEDDEAFIDDEGVAPEERVDFADEDNGITFEEAEEAKEDMEDELDKIFGKHSRRDSGAGMGTDTRRKAENMLALMEAALEADLDAFSKGEPALNKLKTLKKAEEMLSIRRFHEDLMSCGILGMLKGWLEPMPDGSLPNSKVRGGVLSMLQELQVNCSNEDHRDQLKKSGVGKLVMFLSKLPDETPENRKLAQHLVETWSRPILGVARSAEMRGREPEEGREEARNPRSQTRLSREDDTLLVGSRQEALGEERRHAMIPRAAELDYVIRPKSKVTVGPIKQGKTSEPKLLKKLRTMGGKKKVAK